MQTYAQPETPTRLAPGDEDDDAPPAKRRRDPLWAKLCLIGGALLMVVSGGVIVGGKALIASATSGIEQANLIPEEVRAVGNTIEGPLNILLLGMDSRAGKADQIRTDTIIIAHIPADHSAIYMISLPRDTRVEVPAFPASGYPGGTQKLTEAFAVGNRTKVGQKGDLSKAGRERGVALMATTINKLVPGGIKFNAVALIDFAGFQKLVEALGGIYMCIDQKTTSLHYDAGGVYVSDVTKSRKIKPKVYEVGCRNLKPWEALDFVRQREFQPNGDYDRQRHQQQFLQAVFKKLLSKETLTDVGKFNQLKTAAGELFTLDLNGIAIEDWLFSFKHLRAEDMQLIQTNGGTYSSLNINGVSYQTLNDTSMELLEAVKQDKVYEFLVKHPDWIAKNKTK